MGVKLYILENSRGAVIRQITPHPRVLIFTRLESPGSIFFYKLDQLSFCYNYSQCYSR
jgi:hypothetical protein